MAPSLASLRQWCNYEQLLPFVIIFLLEYLYQKYNFNHQYNINLYKYYYAVNGFPGKNASTIHDYTAKETAIFFSALYQY